MTRAVEAESQLSTAPGRRRALGHRIRCQQPAGHAAEDGGAHDQRSRGAGRDAPGVLRLARRFRPPRLPDAAASLCCAGPSSAIESFYDATVELGIANCVTSFTASDFGRTLASNGDGSDHGWGSHHFVVGGAVNGGAFTELARDRRQRSGRRGPGALAADHLGRPIRRGAGELVRRAGRRICPWCSRTSATSTPTPCRCSPERRQAEKEVSSRQLTGVPCRNCQQHFRPAPARAAAPHAQGRAAHPHRRLARARADLRAWRSATACRFPMRASRSCAAPMPSPTCKASWTSTTPAPACC